MRGSEVQLLQLEVDEWEPSEAGHVLTFRTTGMKSEGSEFRGSRM